MAEILRYVPRCSVCGKRVATKLCDFPIGTLQYIGHPPRTFYSYNGFDVGMRRVITCDKPICDVCSVNIGEIDFCKTHKIANGVIVPPCKVGSSVYRITHNYTNGKRMCHISGPIQIVGFHLGTFPTIRGHKRKNYLIGYSDNLLMHLDINEIGKTIFFSEEEAKSKIKEV